MNNLLMLDSGAFAVWNRGKTVDLDAYIQFCKENENCSYYVALDVIPGRPGFVPRDEDREKSCQMSWDNYQKMLKTLPIEKVIPVFHQNENFKWLDKYLDFGTPYVGISPANDKTTGQKLAWLKQVKKHIFDTAGQPIVKTHGFAVTSYKLMKLFQWHSVDSASWVRHSAYGTVYVPQLKNGEWVYDEPPTLLSVSPKSPSKNDKAKHITNQTEIAMQRIDRWFSELGVRLGSFELVDIEEGYKKKKGELAYSEVKGSYAGYSSGFAPLGNEDKKQVLRIKEKGLMTCHQMRFWVNKTFIQRANKVLPVNHIYFAGAAGSLVDKVEYKLKRRLLSYHDLGISKSARKVFDTYMEMM